MFGKKSRLEQDNDALEELIRVYKKQCSDAAILYAALELKYLRNLREYRFSQKSNERRKRANKRLRAMLDDVGWPKNDLNPMDRKHFKRNREKSPERLVPRKLP